MSKEQGRKIVFAVGIILIAAVVVVTMMRSVKNQATKENVSQTQEKITPKNTFKTISPKDLQDQISAHKQLSMVDIRSAESFADAHIMDAISLPTEKSLPFPSIPKENTVIIIGEGAQDAATETAYNAFSEKGYSDVFILTGGMAAWNNLGARVISLGDPTSLSDQAKVSYISTDELKNSLSNKQQFILDIRDKNTFTNGHIENAINIPFDDLEMRRREIPSTRKIIVCGQNELQEFQAAVKISDMLLASPYVLKGSVEKWKQQGFAIVK